MQKSVELPLGAGGTVECATCHDPGKHKTEGFRGAALRLPAPDLCRVCHEESRKMTRAEHGIALGRAHFTSTGVRLMSHGIDEVTRECLGCHDGSVAGERGSGMSIGPQNSHPVGNPYDEHSRSGRKSRLRPRSALPPEVQLVRDTVGCQSCHSPFSHEADMVTWPMRDSALCCACHEM